MYLRMHIWLPICPLYLYMPTLIPILIHLLALFTFSLPTWFVFLIVSFASLSILVLNLVINVFTHCSDVLFTIFILTIVFSHYRFCFPILQVIFFWFMHWIIDLCMFIYCPCQFMFPALALIFPWIFFTSIIVLPLLILITPQYLPIYSRVSVINVLIFQSKFSFIKEHESSVK